MLSFLKRLLGLGRAPGAQDGVTFHPDGSVRFRPPGATPRPDRLASVASDPARREEFIRVLAADGVFVLTAVPPAGSEEVRFLDHVEHGTPVFPVFSSEEHAARYVQGLPLTAITPYQCLGLTADFLLDNEWGNTTLVLNPKSEAETVITAGDLRRLRSTPVAGPGPAADRAGGRR